MKIQRIKRKDLDVEKYSRALENAMNYRIYAEYWYLDVLTNEKWECLVYGDYEVIMPIPLQYKFCFKFVTQPNLCQQLGVFYKNIIPHELFTEFEKKLHSYRVRAYHFNEENTTQFTPKGNQKVNHVLDLNHSYKDIKSEFRKNRKYDLNQFSKYDYIIEDSDEIETLIDLAFDEYPFYKMMETKEKFIEIIQVLKQKRKLTLLKSFSSSNPDNQAFRVLIHSKNREILLMAARNKEYKKSVLDTLLLHSIISNYVDSNTLLDFEGSSIKGVADYNLSWGAKERLYTGFSNFKKPFS